ncbi:MAG TPA: transglycosylase SLT domain-containing protein [Actinomycetota bacterium]|nr:transglycosylase SLT domain-containing protein [Actinomycetota bacterium]
MRRFVAALVLSAVAAGCVVSEAAPRPDPATGETAQVDGSATGSTGVTGATGATGPTPSPGPELPDPDAQIPRGARRLALELETTFRGNRDAIAAWLTTGDPSAWPPPRDVVLLTLHEQRIYRTLSARPARATRTLERLPRDVRREAAANVRAGRALFEHFRPVTMVPDFRIRRAPGADVLLGHFREAEERFGVDWEVLAAIMLVETRMHRIRSRSSAGAVGPMQFLPSTWEAYGMGGDVRDPHDAVLGAANYLRASGAPNDYAAALHAYNPVDAYVTAVWSYARTMMRRPTSYYAYYNWQVFVRTVDGDVRLSGPGT